MTSKSDDYCDEEKFAEQGGDGSRVKVVCDPKKIKILVDPMRRKILRTMREGIEDDDGTFRKEMTVPEIARKLGVSAPKCYHHLDLLHDHGFVKVAKEEKKKRTSITYYERTAPAFVLANTIDEVERKEGIRQHPLIELINDGFLLNLSKEEQAKAQELIDEFSSRSHNIYVEVAKKLKGNIPDDKLGRTIGFVANQFVFNDKRCEEIRDELATYLNIEID